MQPHLTVEQRQLALRLRARGLSLREIGPQVGCSHQSVALVVRQAPRRPVRRDGWVPGPGRPPVAARAARLAVDRCERSVLTLAPAMVRISRRPAVKLGLHPRYPVPRGNLGAVIRRRVLRHCSLLPFPEPLPPFAM
jgi:hypothetical protein